MSRPAVRILFAALAIAFFATPVALRVVGVHANAFENRRLAGPPKLSQGWDIFDQTTAFLTDRMPLREQAVRANTEISTNVFGTTPSYGAAGRDRALPFANAKRGGKAPPKANSLDTGVLEGRDGWLYLRSEFDAACKPGQPYSAALRRWRALLAITRASGRRAVLLVPPDKGSLYPEHLPGFRNKGCALTGKRRLWRLLARPRAGVVGLRDPLLAQKRRGSPLLYARTDSHWTTVGALQLVRSALAAVGRGVRITPGEVRDTGNVTPGGDLLTLRGRKGNDSRPSRSIQRRAGARRVPGRTLYVRDSYGDIAAPLLLPYFADVRQIYWFNSTARARALAIARADTVIYENVEREFSARASEGGQVSSSFLRLLRRELHRRGGR